MKTSRAQRPVSLLFSWLVLPSACVLGLGLSESACGEQAKADAAAAETELSGAARVRADAVRLRPFAESSLARSFLDAAWGLPQPETRTLYVNRSTRAWYTPAQRETMPEADRAALTERVMDGEYYYSTRYGSPLAYVRAIDLIAARDADRAVGDGFARADGFAGKRIIDYGYGTIGHLRLMASCGATVVGLDTDQSLELLYRQPGDVGVIDAAAGTKKGHIALRTGRFPVDTRCTPDELLSIGAAGATGGFDLFISKNTLKNGYINPAQEVDKRMLVDLGTGAPEFLSAVTRTLRPGGLFMIYNLSPAPSKPGEAYKPWSDGRCPFTKEQLDAAGFEVIVFDENDDKAAREMGRLLGWADDPDGEGPQTGMDLENDLFAHWTLARKRGEVTPRP